MFQLPPFVTEMLVKDTTRLIVEKDTEKVAAFCADVLVFLDKYQEEDIRIISASFYLLSLFVLDSGLQGLIESMSDDSPDKQLIMKVLAMANLAVPMGEE